MQVNRKAFEGDNYIKPSGELSKAEYVSWVGNPFLTKRTRQYIRDVYAGRDSFNNGKNNFALRVPITRKRTSNKFYRKMDQAEHNKIAADGVLGAALKYNNTLHYRVWMSTSLPMVRQFYNANAPGGNVIVEMTFDADLIQALALSCKPHQNPGVQSDPTVIAVHREDFAHYGVVDDAELIEVRDNLFDYNLGVCLEKRKAVEDRLTAWRVVV
ncbi:hypothetical protein [Caulobacter sp. LARHSG274]